MCANVSVLPDFKRSPNKINNNDNEANDHDDIATFQPPVFYNKSAGCRQKEVEREVYLVAQRENKWEHA